MTKLRALAVSRKFLHRKKVLARHTSSMTIPRDNTGSGALARLLFGGHFYPYNFTLFAAGSSYHAYEFVRLDFNRTDLCGGFLIAGTMFTLVEYVFHRVVLHTMAYKHHEKHHVFPHKLSLLHIPMSMVVLAHGVSYYLAAQCTSLPILTSIEIFEPLFYLAFEVTHEVSHTKSGYNAIVDNAKTYHKLHHVHASTNYGFTTSFWDYVFGTLSPGVHVSFRELAFGFIPFWSFAVRPSR
jgi:sterol desaturase/sphingolipid hydroxylase (fatty acid hydroxylase superfamily)